MRTFIEKSIVCKEAILDKLVCDICKKEAKYPDQEWSEEDNHPYEEYTLKTTIEHEKSYYCIDTGTDGEVLSFDICPDCFINRLVPFIEGFGNKVNKTILN